MISKLAGMLAHSGLASARFAFGQELANGGILLRSLFFELTEVLVSPEKMIRITKIWGTLNLCS